MTKNRDHSRKMQLVENIWIQVIECVLTTNVKLAPSIASTISKYLSKDGLARTILVVYLETDFLEKFNFNLGYILIKALNPNNQNNTLYRTSSLKLMDIF